MASQQTRTWVIFAALVACSIIITTEGRGGFTGAGGMVEGDRKTIRIEDMLNGKTWTMERTVKENGEVRTCFFLFIDGECDTVYDLQTDFLFSRPHIYRVLSFGRFSPYMAMTTRYRMAWQNQHQNY